MRLFLFLATLVLCTVGCDSGLGAYPDDTGAPPDDDPGGGVYLGDPQDTDTGTSSTDSGDTDTDTSPPASFCGDGTCDFSETASTCPSDCGSVCGDGICDPGEICNADCGSTCGDGICDPGESCTADCGSPAFCGDGTCDPGEDACSCSADCGTCGGGGPSLTWNETVVTRGYEGILGRAPDTGGFNNYVALLDGGWPLHDFAHALWDSPEFAANRGWMSSNQLATELYWGILGRAPDPGGLSMTIQEIDAGRGANRARDMLDSPEAHSSWP